MTNDMYPDREEILRAIREAGEPCEATDELETTIKELIGMVQAGMTEDEQDFVVSYLFTVLESIKVQRKKQECITKTLSTLQTN